MSQLRLTHIFASLASFTGVGRGRVVRWISEGEIGTTPGAGSGRARGRWGAKRDLAGKKGGFAGVWQNTLLPNMC